jgi:hypothetical protein
MAGVLSLFVVSANFPFYFFFSLKEVECLVFFFFFLKYTRQWKEAKHPCASGL